MEKVKIHPTSEIAKECEIGEGTIIWNQAQIREQTQIGNNCVIGKDVYIDTGVFIGNGVKIQNGVSVYKGVTVEDDVFLGPHMTFTNDLYPRAFSVDWEVVPTLVKKGASIGANATIVCGKTIGEYAMVAAGSVVTRDVPPYALVMGNPARIRGFVCKCGFPITCGKHAFANGMFTCEKCKENIRVENICE
jgi:acetyltransferase-like isoleucine patch superfamily enzyme